ncbi:SWIM zinc finger family protein [Micromonospora sp. NPDC003197]
MTDYSEYGRPQRVSGGVRARSTRGAIGQSWWSRRFVDVLESFALGTRLTRGRSYARAGQVLDIDVAPGVVTARVQGSRPRPYRVRIGLHPFPEPVWRRIEELLSAQAFYSARLLAGDLPPELEQVFAEAGAPLFPAGIDDLDLTCNCPDFAVPCKHLAATFYLLAEAFDADPFRILHWRGRDRAGLLARLRKLRTGNDESPAAPRKPRSTAAGADGKTATATASPGSPAALQTSPAVLAPTVGAGLALAELPDVSLADSVDRFWLSPVPLPARTPALPARADLLLRQLGAPGAVIGGPGLTERLRRAYECFGAD